MQTLLLGRHTIVRVWLADLPHASYLKTDLLSHSIKSVRSGLETRQCAIEFFSSTCGPSSYGLLGAKFIPDNTEQLLVQVAVSRDTGDTLEWSLAATADKVHVGLRSEYARAVLDGVGNAKETPTVGAGILLFNCAAHAYVGSSPNVFRKLAGATVWLLSQKTTEAELELLTQGLSAHLI